MITTEYNIEKHIDKTSDIYKYDILTAAKNDCKNKISDVLNKNIEDIDWGNFKFKFELICKITII